MLFALPFRENGIKYRKDEAIGGWFSQIGIMHQVHHMWGGCLITCRNSCFLISCLIAAYKDLNERHETRQSNWQLPGWDECVQKTGLWFVLSNTYLS